MTPRQTKLFLSAVTREFGGPRDEMAATLRGHPNIAVKVQTEFRGSGGILLAKLAEYIRDCHAVIHLIGEKAGWVPPPAEVDRLLREYGYDDFAERVPELAETLTRGERFSYTQWEAYLALYHRRSLFVYRRAGAADPAEEGGRTGWDRSQNDHFNRLRDLGWDRGTFALDADRDPDGRAANASRTLKEAVYRDIGNYLLVGPEAALPGVHFRGGAAGDPLADELLATLRRAASETYLRLVPTPATAAEGLGEWLTGLDDARLGVLVWDGLAAAPPEVCERAVQAVRARKLLPVRLRARPAADGSDDDTDTRPLADLSPQDRAEAVARLTTEMRALAFANAAPRDTAAPRAVPRASLEHLGNPHRVDSAAANFVDRDRQRAMLTGAWQDVRVNVAVVCGPGGFGKSATLRKWIADLELRPHRTEAAVFAYSFDDQGPDPDRFLRAAYRWFAGPTPRAEHRWEQLAAWDRGREVAGWVRDRPAVLLLDGFEHQLNLERDGGGTIRDPGILGLVTSLAGDNSGLLVLASRQPVLDLRDADGGTVLTVPLDSLPVADAATLLENLGVTGTADERRAVARRVHGQALALRLAASYLRERYAGDPARADELRLLDDRRADPARRILEWYERWIEERHEVELRDVLRLLALYDRPVRRGDFHRLRERHIPGLTDRVEHWTEDRVNGLFDRLVRMSLANLGDGGSGVVEFHPLTREFIRERFLAVEPNAWVAANAALFDLFRADADDLPASAEERRLELLSQACAHGCRANRFAAVWSEVFWPLIRRNGGPEPTNHNLRKYKAFAADLAVLREFFDREWGFVGYGLPIADEARITMEAGCDLRAMGRLTEGQGVLRRALRRAEEAVGQAGDAGRPAAEALAAEAAGNLAELLVRRGNLRDARAVAAGGVAHADASGRAGYRVILRSVLANAAHFSGRMDDARRLFAEAEAIQAEATPAAPHLKPVQTFEYADFLLSLGDFDGVLARERPWPNPDEHLFAALSVLPAALVRLAREPSDDTRREARAIADQLYRTGRAEYQPRRFLALAAASCSAGEWDRAAQVLTEGLTFCRRHELRLSEIDLRLALAGTFEAAGNRDRAGDERRQAASAIDECGYHIRRPANG